MIFKKKFKIVFEIKQDENGFDLKLKRNKHMKMSHIEAISKYTQNMFNQYKDTIKKKIENKEGLNND